MIRDLLLSPFRLTGHLSRGRYAVLAPAVFLFQHLLVFGLFKAHHRSLDPDVAFFLMPLRSVARLQHAHGLVLLLALVAMLVVSWILTALSFRRAASAGIEGGIAAAAFIPVLQLPALAILALAPDRPSDRLADPEPGARTWNWMMSAQGVLAAVALTLATVALGALVLGEYGYALFVFSPFVIGVTTGYLANRRQDIGAGATVTVVGCGLLLGGLGLVAVALEGLVCIVMAAPLGAGVGLIGGLLGRAMAHLGNRRARNSAMGLAILPLVFAADLALPPSATFDTEQSVVVAAPPAAVWRALIHMDAIEGKPSLPFRLGVAYPTGARIIGEGVGAERRGAFSTGQAIERISAWEPERRLAFVVLSDPPALHEFSPYDHVHAPHVKGYFRTSSTSFDITPLADGRSRLTLRSAHELRLDPVLYWLPMTRLVVAADNARVLEHVRRQAEG